VYLVDHTILICFDILSNLTDSRREIYGMSDKDPKLYWKKNLQLLLVLLIIWFTFSFGFGILLREPLNEIRMGGFKLGFWFAQQGSIYVFIILIFVYVFRMNKLDKEFGEHSDDDLK